MPCRVNSPLPITMPPMPKISVTATITRLRWACRSTRALIRVFMPTLAMEPNIRIRMPPITGVGMLCSSRPTLPMNARLMANTAVQVITTGLNTLVSITAPVTSE